MAGPRLRDIADALGLSTATVSRAMRDDTRIPKRTQDRVKAALAQSGYVYRRGAASLRTSETHTVGVILNNVSDPFFSALLASLEEGLAKSGRTVFLGNTNESVDRQTEFIRKMTEYNADGIIVSPAIGSTPEDFASTRAGVPPIVFVSRTLFELRYDYVICDDREAGRLATAHLLALGHRRIAAVGGMPGVSCFVERLNGYREALEQAGVAFDESLVHTCIPTRDEGFRAGRRVAGLSHRPTAAICYNDSISLGLYFGLIAQGFSPGKDFALVGHEDVEARLAQPPLSVTAVSRDEMGARAAELLLRRIAAPEAPQQRVVLKTRLIYRGSSNALPAA